MIAKINEARAITRISMDGCSTIEPNLSSRWLGFQHQPKDVRERWPEEAHKGCYYKNRGDRWIMEITIELEVETQQFLVGYR